MVVRVSSRAGRVYLSVMKENGVQAHLTCSKEGKRFVTKS
jgi:hypothetical protein